MTDEYNHDDPLKSRNETAETASAGAEGFNVLTEVDFTKHHRSPPGPGLPESLLWIFGMFVVQGVAMAGIVAILMFFEMGDGNAGNLQNMPEAEKAKFLKSLTKDNMTLILGVVQGITAVVSIIAVYLRLGRNEALNRLPLAGIHVGHFIFFLVLFGIVMIFTSQWNITVVKFWKEVVIVQLPGLEKLEEQSSVNMLKEMVATTPVWMMLLIMAVAPAVTEEIIFRGVIGRGLVARWGVVAGVGMTSCLFALVHVAPAHVVALIPMAIVIQLLHLATRSIWTPILFHFMFNAFAVITMKVMVTNNPKVLEQANQIPPDYPWLLLSGSGICLAAFCWLLWSIRYQYQYADKTEFPEGYIAAEVPDQRRQRMIQGTVGEFQIEPFIVSAVAFGVLIICIVVHGYMNMP